MADNDDTPPSAGFDSSDMVDKLSFESPFVGDDLENMDWNFGGDTVIDINNFVRLTRDRESQSGWVWSKRTLNMSNWEFILEFKIHGEASHLIGDGMAVWFLEQKNFEEGPAMGLRHPWNGFAIFIDTYDNGKNGFVYPRIAGFENKGNFEYNKETDGKGQDVGYCDADVYKRPHPTKLRVSYNEGRGVSVYVHDGATPTDESWKPCFSSTNVKISRDAYIGLTGVTGGLSSNHDINSITVLRHSGEPNVERPPLHPKVDYSKNIFEPSDNERMSLAHFFIILVIVVVIVYGVYVVFRIKAQRDLKRF